MQTVRRVPWICLEEWHLVYKQIYSNNDLEQTKAYKTLLVWKARTPKLPVGIDCTLLLIEVCLRDREWSPKIDSGELSMHYENDLRLMYSTSIMRFLNHVCNIKKVKQNSLFYTASKLKIPEWIVQIRHDAAHGHDLPNIDRLRLAVNILLTWLHEEYWAVEAKSIEDSYMKYKGTADDITNNQEASNVKDDIELWIAISLYSKAKYIFVQDIPDSELRNTLQALRLRTINAHKSNIKASKNYMEADDELLSAINSFKLSTAQSIILLEINKHFSKIKSTQDRSKVVLNTLFESEAFLPDEDLLKMFTSEENIKTLPSSLIEFWQDFIVFLQDKKILQPLFFRLYEIVRNTNTNEHTRLLASLWMAAIIRAVYKQNLALQVAINIDQWLDCTQENISFKQYITKIRKKTDTVYPDLATTFWLNIYNDIPECFTDVIFLRELLLNANEYSINYTPFVLDLMSRNLKPDCKNHLLNIMHIYSGSATSDQNTKTNIEDRIYTVNDVISMKICDKTETHVPTRGSIKLADETIRNKNWELTEGAYDWNTCPVGMLPWQQNSTVFTELEVTTVNSKNKYQNIKILPGMLDTEQLTKKSQINWDAVLQKKPKRKPQKDYADVIMDRALTYVKTNIV